MKIFYLIFLITVVSGCPYLDYGENESCSFLVTIRHATDDSNVEEMTCTCTEDKACKRAIIKGCRDYSCNNFKTCPKHGLTSDGLSETCLQGREVEELCENGEEVLSDGCYPAT